MTPILLPNKLPLMTTSLPLISARSGEENTGKSGSLHKVGSDKSQYVQQSNEAIRWWRHKRIIDKQIESIGTRLTTRYIHTPLNYISTQMYIFVWMVLGAVHRLCNICLCDMSLMASSWRRASSRLVHFA